MAQLLLKKVTIWTSDDAMEVYLKFNKDADPSAMPAVEEIMAYLDSIGIVYGISEAEIRRARESSRDPSVVYVIARGSSAELPVENRIEYFIDFEKTGQPKVLNSGSVDVKDLQLIIPIAAGDKIAKKIPGKFGRAGRTVKGEPIPIPLVKMVELPKGLNTGISTDDQLLLVALKTGNVVKTGSVVNVFEEHVIDRDVDFSTGNISHSGSIRINGSIRSGFSVVAGGNIFVKGNIEDARIECGGNLVVQGGITGNMKNIVFAQANIEALYINGQHVRALGNITVQDECVNAKLEAGDSIYVWKKGVIVGGETYAFNKVDARTLGSEGGVYTDIYFGIDTVLRKRLAELGSFKAKGNQKCSEIRRKLFACVKQAVGSNRELLDAEQQTLKGLKTQLTDEYEKITKQEQEEEKINAKLGEETHPQVTVRTKVFPGVKLATNTTSIFLNEGKNLSCTFMVKGANIIAI
ncbi:MAG: hypothetical protein A2268_09665 [Candidatus Raymondbacteria bacterium RifOxyA12_full_50_37]|uniref:Flagellar Assembly Protein A N-terminal region domain-containing protein n=1 Tax=Candidatus Raymondbacteria bacterium RIFOXYD12_FULL_49_13 TaxID=1817890 RepID=A0A1F7F1H0_UNCRA|nr:MAG: hypothetical protein A2268_09665 [Candidatus Raymondbacteria bacterium RifOxyA12_full_50_37]OGJ93153.1 MAG: hypothetical protein A2350_17860 [Candidatus Raymondbacteria bacterium RifOxyB12_full_50_8]OGJ93893.1 MAG: hypothetical protein A2248_06630 [Candidatus Raymondbacteria bacterium RIFOXYA2_FULL_49_16]OGJ98238.1 MAG: hypothetical protein A2453_00535 [Candidatus Raymondbacteria bacterium RIFOXYC2_FULL_50_21]OGK00471.1 MAG: hypothetical protein A2519_10710 [Candidatus Raymondbacteria b